jgi:hypothetical protein
MTIAPGPCLAAVERVAGARLESRCDGLAIVVAESAEDGPTDTSRIHGVAGVGLTGQSLRNEPAGSLLGRLSTGLARRGPMAFEPFWARSAHVMQFRPVTMDQATKDVANNGEDMHPPNSPKLVPRCGYCRPLWAIGRTPCGGNVKWHGRSGENEASSLRSIRA